MTKAIEGPASAQSADCAQFLDADLIAVLLNNVSHPLAILEDRYKYAFVNGEMLTYWRPEPMIGQTVEEVIGELGFSAVRPLIDRAWAGERCGFEGWLVSPVLGKRYMAATLVPYAPGGGPVKLVAILSQDRTDLKRREEELADRLAQLNTSEALKSAIVDHAFTALISADADGRIVEFNPSAERIFGRKRSGVVGLSVSEVLIPPRLRGAHDAGMQRMQAGEPGRVIGKRLEMHALRSDGSEFPMEMLLWRTDVEGTVFYTASIVDVSAQRDAAQQIERQREALRQSEKLTTMGSLLAGVAHELNNPLAIVMGRAQLLEEKCAEHPSMKSDAARIREAAERCGRIVRMFLNMARSKPSSRSAVELNDVIRSAVDMLLYAYRTHDIDLDLALFDRLPTISADGDRIGQIVMNLLLNAQQALSTSQGPRRIRIETGDDRSPSAPARNLWMCISDNGPGVPEALRPRLFEPFFTTKIDGAGTGLGLSMSRSLAREHSGELALEAGSRIGGASFLLTLPVIDAEKAGKDEPPSAADSGNRARVLVVDDEADLTELIRDMLEAANYEVATAESGALALEMLKTARFDIVVTDLHMPDIDGAALWKEISVLDPRLARNVLFVTGDTLSRDASQFLKTSNCIWLDKPFTKADLLAKVASLV